MKKIYLTLALLSFFNFSFGQTNTFPTSGDVGVGTTNPASVLHLNGVTTTNPLGTVILTIQAAHSSGTIGSGGIIKFINNVATADVATIRTHTEGPNNVSLRFQTGYGVGKLTDKMIISNSGNVGIGTMTPDSKLAVNGNIRAKEIKVELTGWADFVFAKDYKLPSLLETENHIKEKGHLPGIPSAAEVQANGVELGEMNKKLLQKIEELTLHLIEQKKKNDLHTNQINELTEIVKQLKENHK